MVNTQTLHRSILRLRLFQSLRSGRTVGRNLLSSVRPERKHEVLKRTVGRNLLSSVRPERKHEVLKSKDEWKIVPKSRSTP